MALEAYTLGDLVDEMKRYGVIKVIRGKRASYLRRPMRPLVDVPMELLLPDGE